MITGVPTLEQNYGDRCICELNGLVIRVSKRGTEVVLNKANWQTNFKSTPAKKRRFTRKIMLLKPLAY